MLINLFSSEVRIKRISGVCGILIPVIIFICIGIALYYSPWFIWTKNALSDLGVEGISAIFFNSGMIIGGILAFVFSLGLIKTFQKKIGPYILSLSALALIGIGVFPETVFTIHLVFSASFFILLAVSLLTIGMTIRRYQSEYTLGFIATFISILATSSLFLLIIWDGVAIPETLSCFPAFIWCMIYGAKMVIS